MGHPTCATYNRRMLNPFDFRHETLIHINIQMIHIARQVSGPRSGSFWNLLPSRSIGVAQTYLV